MRKAMRYCPKFKDFGGGIKRDDVRIKQFFDKNIGDEEE